MATGFSVKDALNKQSKAGLDESPRARFRTKDISIFKMYRNEMNFYSIEQIEELASDILMYGLKQNLELVYAPCEKGEYRIVAGERRWEALKYLVSKGYKEFELATSKLTTPQDSDEELVELIIANAYRTKTVSDMLQEEQKLKECLERMKAEGKKLKGYDLQSGRLRDVIAAKLSMSKTKIAQIEAINNNLIPEWKEELENERITFSAAYELSGMQEDTQRAALEQKKESGELTHKDVKEMKNGKPEQQLETGTVSQSDTEEKPEQQLPGKMEIRDKDMNMGEYQTPHPEGITSICYSCTEYETCNVKTSTCTSCDQYKNRKEAYKTEGQKYEEEQAAIDRDTRKKLRDMADAQQMEQLPSDVQQSRVHQIRSAYQNFTAVLSGEKPFELCRDCGYEAGDILEMLEYQGGLYTERKIRCHILYVQREYTGLEDGYCIVGILPMGKEEEEGEKNE